MNPVIENFQKANIGKISVLKLNVDNEREIAEKFQIRSIPTFFILKNGEVIKSFVGFHTLEQLDNIIKNTI
jgi:thioredoxin 1